MLKSLPKVYLVRHGATAWSVTGQHTGRINLPLTEQGEAEAEKLAPLIKALGPLKAFASPLQRARRTAAIVGYEQPELLPDLMEWDYGKYEGKTKQEISETIPAWDVFVHGCEGGENLNQISERAGRVVELLRKSEEDVLLFAHGHLLRILACAWLGWAPEVARQLLLSTGSLSVLGYNHNLSEPAIRSWNQLP